MHVCDQCIDADGLAQIIRENVAETECDYCGRTDKKAIAADVDDVAAHMRWCIERDYCDPEESLYHDRESPSGYAGDTWYTSELLSDVFGFWPSEQCPKAAELFDDLCEAVSTDTAVWASNDPGGLPLDDDVLYDWERFCKIVRHRQRFFAFGETTNVAGEPRSPSSLFRFLAKAAVSAGLIRQLSAGTPVFRARQCDVANGPLDVGPPTEADAKQNRMSPAGIPMFYGAKAAATALAEVVDGTGTYHVGEFHLVHPIKVLDLADLPAIPSYWLRSETEDGSRRDRLRFFTRFAHELARPVASDDRVHVEYVPTQVLTEFFRVVFELPEGEHLRGIAYPSAKHAGGVCYVLFAGRDDLVWSPQELAGLSPFEKSTRLEKEKSAWIKLHALAKHIASISFGGPV